MSRRAFPWNVLKIDSSADTGAIRKAYADLLRAMNPDDDPAAFANLRRARDHALALAKSRAARAVEDGAQGHDAGPAEHVPDQGWIDPGAFGDASGPETGGHDRADREFLGPAMDPIDAAIADPAMAPPALPDHAHVADGLTAAPPSADSDDYLAGLGNPDMELRRSQPDRTTPGHHGTRAPVLAEIPAAPDAVVTQMTAALPDPADEAAIAARYALDTLLLTGQTGEPLDTGEALDLLATVLNDPALDRVSERMGIERWLAGAVAAALPRSEPFVRPLADHFGWREDAKTIGQSGTIAYLADYALAQDFRERLERPDNKGHKAWKALTTPGPVPWYSRRPPYLKELMQVIREQHPLLERAYDEDRFHHWATKADKGEREGGSNWGWIIIGIIVIFAAIGQLGGPEVESDREQQARVQLAEFDDPARRRATIDDVLRAAGGEELDAAAMEAHDSAFFRQLDERLLDMKGQAQRLEVTEPLLAQMVRQRIRGALEDVGQADLVAYRSAQASLAEERLRADRSRAACYDIVGGTPSNLYQMPLELREAWQEGQRRMLLGSRALPADQPGGQQFNLLTTTWADAARRAEMSQDEFFAAFRGDRGDNAYCRVYVALLRTALARPGDPDRLDVLRRL